MIWLGIDTANAPLAVAVMNNDEILVEIKQHIKLTHSIGAMPAIEEALQRANIEPKAIDAIAVSIGPGSYTGVRIGVTIAKTLGWTLQIPVVPVSSLKILASNIDSTTIICPVIDARRNNVYAAIYQGNETLLDDGHYSMETVIACLESYKASVNFVGMDAIKYEEQIKNILGDKATIAPPAKSLPSAVEAILLAQQMTLPTIEAVHQLVPVYKRITEAEANWLKEQQPYDN